jgi:hypothetical protein
MGICQEIFLQARCLQKGGRMPGIFGSEIREIGEMKAFADLLIPAGGLRGWRLRAMKRKAPASLPSND